MNFVLRNIDILTNCITTLQSLFMGGGTWEVVIREYKKSRSDRQNNMYWGWLKIISDETGYTTEELHEYMKGNFWGYREAEIFGEKRMIPKSTTKLSTKEFNEYLDKVTAFATSIGIKLPLGGGYE
jgi:hypothetical protein